MTELGKFLNRRNDTERKLFCAVLAAYCQSIIDNWSCFPEESAKNHKDEKVHIRIEWFTVTSVV